MTAPTYSTYHCKIHNKHIYFFKEDTHITGKYHCWDCQHQENKESVSKKQEK